MAGEEGFEPSITGPKPVALPLGYSPLELINFISELFKIQTQTGIRCIERLLLLLIIFRF